MSWLRRLLLLAGLMTGAWLLGNTGQANADVEVRIDQLGVEIQLPVVDIGLKVETGLAPQQRQPPAPPVPDPRTEIPAPPVATPAPPQPVDVEAPAPAEMPKQQHTPPPSTTRPTNPAPVPPQPQPQAEPPITGTLPQSGASAASGSQIPAGTLTYVMRQPTTTTSLVSTEQQDVPRTVRAEEPTFSPD
jgi:outer membrane biosynthesis protein TonB